MNNDILTGKWNQLKGEVKRTFGKLTDNDMMVIQGDLTKAAGLVQERYGTTHEEAAKRWNDFTNRFTGTAADMATKATDQVQHVADATKSKK